MSLLTGLRRAMFPTTEEQIAKYQARADRQRVEREAEARKPRDNYCICEHPLADHTLCFGGCVMCKCDEWVWDPASSEGGLPVPQDPERSDGTKGTQSQSKES